MSYSQNSKIEAADFNGLVGVPTTSTTGEFNTIWATGNGNRGYGQVAIPQVSANATIYPTDWANLTNRSTTAATHQGTTITAVTTAVQGGRINYTSAIPTNISSLTSARLNAIAQGTTITNTATAGTTWNSQLTFTHTVTFPSADQARYFFNAGGQIALNFSSPSGTGVTGLMNTLATACGTIVISAQNSGTATIAGTTYNGVTKIGGSGTPTTLSTNSGYYGLSTANTEIFKQFASGTPAGYLTSFISVYAKTNGTQGANGDNGTTVNIYTIWDEVPNGNTAFSTVAVGTATTVSLRPPSSTYLSNSWGTPTVSGTVTGS